MRHQGTYANTLYMGAGRNELIASFEQLRLTQELAAQKTTTKDKRWQSGRNSSKQRVRSQQPSRQQQNLIGFSEQVHSSNLRKQQQQQRQCVGIATDTSEQNQKKFNIKFLANPSKKRLKKPLI